MTSADRLRAAAGRVLRNGEDHQERVAAVLAAGVGDIGRPGQCAFFIGVVRLDLGHDGDSPTVIVENEHVVREQAPDLLVVFVGISVSQVAIGDGCREPSPEAQWRARMRQQPQDEPWLVLQDLDHGFMAEFRHDGSVA
jgi:hypothetical protein